MKEVTVTDKWGDVQDCLTVTDLIKRSFDKTLEKKVDSSGNFSNDYNAMPLVKYLMGKRMEELVQAKIKPLQKDIDNAIANAVNAGIRKNVSDKFAEMIIQTAKQTNHAAIENKQ